MAEERMDLFGVIDALFTKAEIDSRAVTPFIVHRFLASDPGLAVAAKYLQRDLPSDPAMVFRTWQGFLPRRLSGAPRFAYVAAKKLPKADALLARVMEVEGWRREIAEQNIELWSELGTLPAVMTHYGIEGEEA